MNETERNEREWSGCGQMPQVCIHFWFASFPIQHPTKVFVCSLVRASGALEVHSTHMFWLSLHSVQCNKYTHIIYNAAQRYHLCSLINKTTTPTATLNSVRFAVNESILIREERKTFMNGFHVSQLSLPCVMRVCVLLVFLFHLRFSTNSQTHTHNAYCCRIKG